MQKEGGNALYLFKEDKTMTNITQIRNELKQEVSAMLPSYEMRDAEVVKFNDRKLLGLTAVKPGENMGPTIWVNDFGDAIDAGVSLREIAKYVTEVFRNVPTSLESLKKAAAENNRIDLPFEKIRDKVFPRIADISRNQAFLANKAYREVGCGLALMAVIDVASGPEGNYAVTVTNELASDQGYDIDLLLDQALENLKPFMAPVEAMIHPFSPVIPNCLDDPQLFAASDRLFSLSNEEAMFGAAALFVPGMMDRLYKMMGGFYVLPSSVHEMLLLPEACCDDPLSLKEIIREANANSSVVSEEDILSDKLMHYDGKELKEVQNV